MFKSNDGFVLTAMKTIDKHGNNLDYYLTFPIPNNKFSLPQEILQISVFEYRRENDKDFECEVFKICLGKATCIREICKLRRNSYRINKDIFQNITSVDDKLCYYDDINGKHIVYTNLNDGDIVVENMDEFKEVLIMISNQVQNIKQSLFEIKNCGKKSIEKTKVYKR